MMDDEKRIVPEKTGGPAEFNLVGDTANTKITEPAKTSPTPEIKKPGELSTDSGGDAGKPPRTLSRPTPKTARRKRSRWWLWVLLLLVVIGAGAGYYFWQNSQQTTTGFTGQTSTVGVNTPVSLTVGATGQVQAKADLALTFGSAGTATEVLAKAGDAVKKGDVIAKIDDSDLQTAVKTSLSSLNSAKANLDTTKAGSTAEQIQIAEEQVKQAKLKADTTRNGNSLPTDIQSARSQLNSAVAKLELLRQGGTPSAKATAKSNLSSAQANLNSVQAKLDLLLAGPTAATISAAQLKYDQAQTNFDKTKSNLYASIVNAQVSRDQALTALNRAQDAYSTQYNNDHNTDGTLKPGVKDADIQNETNLKRSLEDAQGNFNKADVALNDAKVNSDTGIRNAQSSLNDAKVQLDTTKAGPTDADIAAARASVDQTKSSVDSANAAIVNLTPTAADIAAAQASVDSANANLVKLTTGGTASDIATAESNVQIQELTLQNLKNGPTPSTLAVQQAQVDSAQANYDKAVTALNNAVVKAPFDGILSSVGVIVGQAATASTAVTNIVDTSELHVDVNVGESDISKIKLNQGVTLGFDAIASRSFTGKVTFISPKSQVSSNVVSYLVTVTLDGQGKNSLQEAFPDQYQKYLDTIRAQFQRAAGQAGAANGTPGTATTAAGGAGGFQIPAGAQIPAQFQAQVAQLRNSSSFCGFTPTGGAGFGGAAGGGRQGAGNPAATTAGNPAVTTAPAGTTTPGANAGGGRQGGGNNAAGAANQQIQAQPKIGMTATVTVCLDVKAGVLSVPTRAIKTNTTDRTRYVEILDANGNTVKRTVTAGLQGDTATEITGGELKDGDKAIISSTPTNRSTGTNNNPFGGGGGGGIALPGGGGR